MAFGGYVVEALIRFNTNGIQTMERLSAATNRAAINQAVLTGNISKQEAAWLRNAAAIEANARAHARLKASIAGTIAAIGGVTIWQGMKDAGEFQRAMTSVAINLPHANQAAMRAMVLHVSSMTAQSATTIANELATVAAAGIKDQGQIQTLFPLFAKAADVGFLSPKHLDPVETIKQLSQFSHIFGVYRGKQLDDMVNSAIRMLSVQPEGLQQMTTQGRLFVGSAMARGVPMDEIFRQFMLMGQTGFLRGRGGSGIENVMDYLEGAESLSNHMSKVRRAAFLDMSRHGAAAGLGAMFDENGRLKFIDKEGNLHLEKAEQYLAQLAKYMDKGEFSNDLVNAFGKQGRNFITVATRPAVQEQMQRNRRAFLATPGVDQQWSMYMDNFLGQLAVAGTNLKNVLISIFLPVLPGATKALKAIADGLGWVGSALEAHPGVGAAVAGFIGALTAAAGAAAIGFTISAMTIPRNLATIAASIEAFAAATTAEAGQISGAGVAAAGGLGTLRGAIISLLPWLARAAPIAATLMLKGDSGTPPDPQGRIWSNLYRTWVYPNQLNPHTGTYLPQYDPSNPQSGAFDRDALHRSGGDTFHINGITIVSNADTLEALKRDIQKNMPQVKRMSGAVRPSPRGRLGALDNFLPGGAY